jgi:hypothetical protein
MLIITRIKLNRRDGVFNLILFCTNNTGRQIFLFSKMGNGENLQRFETKCRFFHSRLFILSILPTSVIGFDTTQNT